MRVVGQSRHGDKGRRYQKCALHDRWMRSPGAIGLGISTLGNVLGWQILGTPATVVQLYDKTPERGGVEEGRGLFWGCKFGGRQGRCRSILI